MDEEFLKKYGEVDLKYNLKTLWNFLRKYKTLFWGLIFVIFIGEIIVFMDNFIFKYLVDKATLFSQEAITMNLFAKIILYTVLVFLAIKLAGAVFWYVRMHLTNRLESGLMSDIEKKAFWHISNLSYRFHLNKKTGSIISQFTRGINNAERFADAFIFNFVPVTFKIILSLGVIVYFDKITALILLGMVTLFIFTGVYITNKQKKPQNLANYREDTLKQNLGDVFLNIETVKYFAKEKRTFNYFSKLSNLLKKGRFKYWTYFSWHSGIQTAILGLGVAAIFYASFTSFMNGNISLGSITLIYAAIWKLIPNLFGLIHGYRDFIRSGVDIDALFKMFKEKNEIVNVPNARELKVKEGKIEFKEVTFTYPSTYTSNISEAVLKNFNLKVGKNMKVALVGPSGSGKTTVIKLLYRLFDLDEGQILIDGQDISKVTQLSLRSNMSIVPQEPLLFDNTIYFNIAYANPRANKQEIWKAIKFAKLDKFIKNLPAKEKTIVGERGIKLSGGEKQRVSIARAILADKQILILDEATSALDSETEREIQQYLEKLMEGRTTLMIAHRLSTIMKADMIVVMNRGNIAEIGTHKELANRRGGIYRRLWSLQQGGLL